MPPCWINGAGGAWAKYPGEELLVCKNGILHLPSFVAIKRDDDNVQIKTDNVQVDAAAYLRPATPQLFCTSALDYDFDPFAAVPPIWLDFLGQLWRDDQASIDALQEWFGLSLVPWTALQKILLLVGPKRSGKGTLARVLRAIVGDANVCNPTLAGLATNFGLQPLLGKTLAVISDARLGGRVDQAAVTERLLSISGEDSITVDRKHMEGITSKLLVRFVIISNELPRLQDSSGALTGRFVTLRLTESFYGREDTTLSEKLLEHRAGILNWAIEGWHRLRQRGHFVQPESSADLREQMDDLSSPIAAFLRDKCVIDDRCEVRVSALFEAWKSWCEANNREAGTPQVFGRDLLAAAPRIRITRPNDDGERVRVYQGIGLP